MSDRAQSEKEGGSFSAGLVLGAIAGVSGMFLFGTKKGNKTLEKLKLHWEKMQPKIEAELEERGHQLERSKKPFLQAIREIVDYVAETLETTESKRRSSPSKSLPASTNSSSMPVHGKKMFYKKK